MVACELHESKVIAVDDGMVNGIRSGLPDCAVGAKKPFAHKREPWDKGSYTVRKGPHAAYYKLIEHDAFYVTNGHVVDDVGDSFDVGDDSTGFARESRHYLMGSQEHIAARSLELDPRFGTEWGLRLLSKAVALSTDAETIEFLTVQLTNFISLLGEPVAGEALRAMRIQSDEDDFVNVVTALGFVDSTVVSEQIGAFLTEIAHSNSTMVADAASNVIRMRDLSRRTAARLANK